MKRHPNGVGTDYVLTMSTTDDLRRKTKVYKK